MLLVVAQLVEALRNKPAGKSRVRFSTMSFEFFIDLILLTAQRVLSLGG
jgi:hypothetical protein